MNRGFVSSRKMPSPHPGVLLYEVVYKSRTLNVKGLLARPLQEGFYPGLLYLRGGLGRVGMVRVSRLMEFVSRGFVVFAPYYRGNKGGEGREDFAGCDRYDAIDAVDVLRGCSFVQRDQIHVFGFSRGGLMALWTGIYRSDIRSIVLWGSVSDLSLTYVERPDLRRMLKRVIGGSVYKYPERYQWRTPLGELERLTARLLIIHGAKDQNVSMKHVEKLQMQLQRLHHPFTTWVFEQYTHYVPKEKNRDIVRELTAWMKKQKKDVL